MTVDYVLIFYLWVHLMSVFREFGNSLFFLKKIKEIKKKIIFSFLI